MPPLNLSETIVLSGFFLKLQDTTASSESVDLDNLFSFLTDIPVSGGGGFLDDIDQQMSALAQDVQGEVGVFLYL